MKKIIFIAVFFITYSFSGLSQDLEFGLLEAVFNNNDTLVISLLEHGAQVNAATIDGVTPLMFASQNNNLEMVKLLLNKGAEIQKKPMDGRTALMAAVRANALAVANLLIEKGANVNDKDIYDATCLHYAASFGYGTMVWLLLENGALSSADNNRTFPLHEACQNGHTDIARMLIDTGQDIEVRDKLGNTPLMLAAQEDQVEVVSMLTKKGAKLQTTNNRNFDAFSIAVENGSFETLKYLSEFEIDINRKIEKKVNPLFLATTNKEKEIKKYLISKGAASNWVPMIGAIIVGFEQNFNLNDYMFGLQTGFIEEKTKISFNTGFNIRPFRKFVWLNENDTLIYQLREYRSFFYVEAQKYLSLSQLSFWNAGIFGGIRLAFPFGNYRATNRTVDRSVKVVPQLGYYFQLPHFMMSFSYEYCKWGVYKLPASHVNLSCKVLLSKNKYLKIKKDPLN